MTGSHRSLLRRTWPQWPQLTLGSWAIVVPSLYGLTRLGSVEVAVGGLLAVAVVLVVQAGIVFRSVERLSRAETTAQPITLATWVTIARGACVALLAGFIVTTPTGIGIWLPAALFFLAAGLDAIDGVIARRTDSVTELGSTLDVEMDALAVLVGTLVAIVEGAVPAVFLLVGAARYLFVAGTWWRRQRGRPVFDLPESRVRRPLGALAMLAIWLALLPVPGDGLSQSIAILVLVPFLVNFCVDWFAVSGRLGDR